MNNKGEIKQRVKWLIRFYESLYFIAGLQGFMGLRVILLILINNLRLAVPHPSQKESPVVLIGWILPEAPYL